jgi:quercetin dioxygenase-like cupin family protein
MDRFFAFVDMNLESPSVGIARIPLIMESGIVLAGELWMQLDEEEVHLKSGDVVIQRGTIHNWENRGAEPCIMAFILIATEGGETTGWS